jgi:Ser/Thr protein kinase RdoA (MazF antagonist)
MSELAPHPHQPHVGSSVAEQPLRERFDGSELAIVLSHYDLGVLEQLRTYPRGSRRSPKMRIKSRVGEFLLKRRAPRQDDPYRVAFAHEIQLRLEHERYPVPGLIGTRDNNSMLQLNGRTYELFRFVHGARYDRSSTQSRVVGMALGRLHALLRGFRPTFQPPVGSFHQVAEIDAKMALLPPAIFSVEPQTQREPVVETAEYLRRAYRDAARRVEDAGFERWPQRVIHGDWHPGNLLFHGHAIVGVIDFDSSRLEPRAVDVANAALQFSIRWDHADQPEKWPDSLDAEAIHGVVKGYDETADEPLSPHERAVLPWLMVEALIIESMVPIATTGSFARIPGSAFLRMIERTVKWLRPRAGELMNA